MQAGWWSSLFAYLLANPGLVVLPAALLLWAAHRARSRLAGAAAVGAAKKTEDPAAALEREEARRRAYMKLQEKVKRLGGKTNE